MLDETKTTSATLYTRPIHIKEANEFVKKYHRHSIPTVGGKFAIAVCLGDELVGVAICGRPVARLLDDGFHLEILRVCVVEGVRNANSFLYSRAAKIGRLMGYSRIVTYTLEGESASSLRAVGAALEAVSSGGEWSRPIRRRRTQDVYKEKKMCWYLS